MWKDKFLKLDMAEVFRNARLVKLRDREQSIGQDLDLMREAIELPQPIFSISNFPYIEKTKTLLQRMYGDGVLVTEEENFLITRLNSLMNEALTEELVSIFELAFLHEDNTESYYTIRKLMRQGVFSGSELSSYMDIALMLSHDLENRIRSIEEESASTLETDENGSRLLDTLNQSMQSIFTKERLRTNHMIYAISVTLSKMKFDSDLQRWQESPQTENTPIDYETLRLLENNDIEGFLFSAINFLYEASQISSNGESEESFSESYSLFEQYRKNFKGYYCPILEMFGFADMVSDGEKFFEERTLELSCCDLNQITCVQKGYLSNLSDRELKRRILKIHKRINEGVLIPQDEVYVVHSEDQREILNNLGFKLDEANPYQDLTLK